MTVLAETRGEKSLCLLCRTFLHSTENGELELSVCQVVRKEVSGAVVDVCPQVSSSKLDDIITALGEAISNCIKHGHDSRVAVFITCVNVTICVDLYADSHLKYGVDEIQPKIDAAYSGARDLSEESGRGIQMICTLAKEVKLEGNRLRMLFSSE